MGRCLPTLGARVVPEGRRSRRDARWPIGLLNRPAEASTRSRSETCRMTRHFGTRHWCRLLGLATGTGDWSSTGSGARCYRVEGGSSRHAELQDRRATACARAGQRDSRGTPWRARGAGRRPAGRRVRERCALPADRQARGCRRTERVGPTGRRLSQQAAESTKCPRAAFVCDPVNRLPAERPIRVCDRALGRSARLNRR
jgi:hypothetical protein